MRRRFATGQERLVKVPEREREGSKTNKGTWLRGGGDTHSGRKERRIKNGVAR